jgi:hypothetical protein
MARRKLFPSRYEAKKRDAGGWDVVRTHGLTGWRRRINTYTDKDGAHAVAHVLGEYAYLEK